MGRKTKPQPEKLAAKLKQVRNMLDLGQAPLAGALTCEQSPVLPSHVSAFELGKRQPSLITIVRYARLAGISTDALIDDDMELPFRLPRRRARLEPSPSSEKRKPNVAD